MCRRRVLPPFRAHRPARRLCAQSLHTFCGAADRQPPWPCSLTSFDMSRPRCQPPLSHSTTLGLLPTLATIARPKANGCLLRPQSHLYANIGKFGCSSLYYYGYYNLCNIISFCKCAINILLYQLRPLAIRNPFAG